MFTARGLAVVETTPEHHDRMMATVQVLTHFQTQVHGLTLARLGAPLAESLRFTSPAYLMELYMGARHFAQSADLYGPIEMKNPATPGVTATYLETAREVADILASGDRDRFRAMFTEVQEFLGSVHGRGARADELPDRSAGGTNVKRSRLRSIGVVESVLPGMRSSIHPPGFVP